MKTNKNLTTGLLILAALLAAVLLAYIFLRPIFKISSSKVTTIENTVVSQAKAQSYSAEKNPTLKTDDKIFGSREAELKIFVYEDNVNIYSAQLADTLDKLNLDMSGKIAIIVRPFITKSSELSKESALAVECAGTDKWMSMRALLFAKTKNSNLSFADFGNYSTEIGLNQDTFAACLTNSEKSAKIEELSAEAATYNVQGAPTIFIGDEMILGARPYEDFIDSNGDTIEGLKTTVEKKLK
jgi:protein-disulfide isomerase